jgi:acyl carrier protein
MVGYDESLRVTCELLRRQVPETREIHAADDIQSDLGLDSLSVMELVADIETRFGINIPADVFGKIVTVADVARAVTKLGSR